jgi:HTH-type transcriptional repressor of puuD
VGESAESVESDVSDADVTSIVHARDSGAAVAGVLSAEKVLGNRLRLLRLQSGMSLRALARELGISPSAVSQIETGVMVPSVNRLIAIVTVLEVPLSAVFEVAAEQPPTEELAIAAELTISRSGQVPSVLLAGGVVYRRLSPGIVSGMEIFESTYPPGSSGDAHGDLFRHHGFELGSILSGCLTIEFEEGRVVTLEAGDSITFSAEVAHRLSNTADVDCVAIWLISY